MLLASCWCSAKADLDGVSPDGGKKRFIHEEAACLGCVLLSLTWCGAPMQWDGVCWVQGQCQGGFGSWWMQECRGEPVSDGTGLCERALWWDWSCPGVVLIYVLLVARHPNRAPPWLPDGMRSPAAQTHTSPSPLSFLSNSHSWPSRFNQRLLSVITLSSRGEAGTSVELSTTAEISAPQHSVALW